MKQAFLLDSDKILFEIMTQAAFDLQRTDKKVLDIALKYGYAYPTSFNRAFQNVHGEVCYC
ncbi:hypothetical protein ACS127_12930 [Amphibacillus sp. Q70]|uniref:hypothetical protein n=1 Tax=Amphibacillus sp. Q70 TaxID=3453416 RepID=UPI003F85433C